MNDDEIKDMVGALSAPVAALEMAVAALAQSPALDRAHILRVFDMLAEALEADCLRQPIADEHEDRVRGSLADVRKMLE